MWIRRFSLLIAAIAVVGCKSGVTEGPPDPGAVEVELEPSSLKRLTAAQYVNVLRDTFGDELVVPARLEPDVESAGSIALGASKTTISERGAELYEAAAIDVAEQVASRSGEWADCAPSQPTDEPCYETVAGTLGKRLWRRPLTDPEISRLATIAAESGRVLSSWEGGVTFLVSAMLQSPHFLFRAEIGTLGDGDPRQLGAFELASRLSFFLWNSAPDDTLLAVAESGELLDDGILREQTRRMLEDPRARRGIRAFFNDLYGLHRLDEVSKAPEIFPHFTDTYGSSAREETLRMLEHHIFEERGDYRDLLTTRTTFINRELAAAYSVRAPARDGFEKVEYDESNPRAGLLGQASVLSLYSHPVATSPTLRGMFVRTKLLCQAIPPPPSNVDTSIPEPTGDAPTLRDRIQQHLEDPACASCHRITDPIGLGMENFDGIGRFRERENGHLIDASGDIDGEAYEGLETLAETVRDHPRFVPCFAQNVYGYATGHEVTSDEEELINALVANFEAADYDVLALIEAVVVSSGFRSAGDPANQQLPTVEEP